MASSAGVMARSHHEKLSSLEPEVPNVARPLVRQGGPNPSIYESVKRWRSGLIAGQMPPAGWLANPATGRYNTALALPRA